MDGPDAENIVGIISILLSLDDTVRRDHKWYGEKFHTPEKRRLQVRMGVWTRLQGIEKDY